MFSTRAFFGGDKLESARPAAKKVSVKKKSADMVLGVTLRRPLNSRQVTIEELVIAELFEGGLLASTTTLSVCTHSLTTLTRSLYLSRRPSALKRRRLCASPDGVPNPHPHPHPKSPPLTRWATSSAQLTANP